MLGTNPVRQQEDFGVAPGQQLEVVDIWSTIQGEGPFSGRPAIFVRLQGCNLRCFWCDTEFDQGDYYTLDEIMNRIKQLQKEVRTNLVVLTGGEPFRQNFIPLVHRLNKRAIVVQVETAGTLWWEEIPRAFYSWKTKKDLTITRDNKNIIVCSPKTPKLNKELLPYIDFFKYVHRHGGKSVIDGLPEESTQRRGKKAKLFRPPTWIPNQNVYVIPCDDKDLANNEVSAAKVCMIHGYNLAVQVHKKVGLR